MHSSLLCGVKSLKNNSTFKCLAKTNRYSATSLGKGDHASDEDLGQYSNQGQENESQAQLLTEESDSVGIDDGMGYKLHLVP